MDTKRRSGTSLMSDGIINLVGGVVLLFLTSMSQMAIVWVFAAFAIILGIAQMVATTGERDENKSTGYLYALGVYSLIAGIGLLFFMSASLVTVIGLVAAYVIIVGIAEMIVSYVYRSEMGGYAWFLSSGIIGVLFGLFLLLNTGVALSTFILYVALYAIVQGIVTTVFGYEVYAQMGKWHQPQVQ